MAARGPVSDTEVDEITPPMLLDDQMKALLVNDPKMCQEAWDVEDILLLSKHDSLMVAHRHQGLLETLAVPWALLIDNATLNKPSSGAGALVANAATAVAKAEASTDDGTTTTTVANRGLARFMMVARLVENLRLSRQLCSDALWAHVKRTCSDSTGSSNRQLIAFTSDDVVKGRPCAGDEVKFGCLVRVACEHLPAEAFHIELIGASQKPSSV